MDSTTSKNHKEAVGHTQQQKSDVFFFEDLDLKLIEPNVIPWPTQ